MKVVSFRASTLKKPELGKIEGITHRFGSRHAKKAKQMAQVLILYTHTYVKVLSPL